MKKTIWKFEFEIQDKFRLDMPNDAKVLTAFVQQPNSTTQIGPVLMPAVRKACLWAEVDTDRMMFWRHFIIVGTGNPLPDDINTQWIATFPDPPFIWHLYEVSG